MHLLTNPQPDRTCILVLGMRSGTSALARCLSLLGAGLPAQLLPGNDSNKTGHWEPAQIVDLNDRLLGRLGARWDTLHDPDFSRLPNDVRSSFRNELTSTLAREYGEAPLIVLKEPRIGRLVPFYVEALEAAGYGVRVILSQRDPLAVAMSFAARDRHELGYTMLLWISYALSVEHSTRGLRRTFLSYEDLMADPGQVLRRAGEALGLAYPRPLPSVAGDIRTYLTHEHYHNHPGLGEVPAFVADSYDALEALAQHDMLPPVLRILDRQRGLVTRMAERLDPRRLSLSRLDELARASHRDFADA